MAATVHVTPRRSVVKCAGRPVDIAEIHLPGTPRGAVLVMTSGRDFEPAAAELLNGFAAFGYEGLAADAMKLRGTRAELTSMVGHLLKRLGDRGWRDEQIGVVGYSWGGLMALLAGVSFELGAVVSVSPQPRCGSSDDLIEWIGRLAPLTRAPWLCLTGADDPALPASVRDGLERTLRNDASTYTQIVSYVDVGQDFYRTSPDIAATAAAFDSWQRTVEWLELRVAPRLTPLTKQWRQRQTVLGGSSTER